MKITKQDKNRYLYEYAFYDVIRDYNEGQGASARPDRIMASEGRRLRVELRQLLTSRELRMDSLTPVEFRNAVDEVLTKRMGEAPYGDAGKSRFAGQMRDYISLLNIEDRSATELGKNGYLPISPYDERFAPRNAVLDNGSRLGGVAADKAEQAEDLMYANRANKIEYTGNLRMRKMKDGTTMWVGSNRGEMCIVDSDMLDITRLKRFMPAKDFERCAQWVAMGSDVSSMSREDLKMRRAMVDRSVAVLEALDAMGRDYEIKPDSNPGQLQAVIKGTRVSVRIMDTAKDFNYIGRVYDNGMTILPKSTNTRMATPNDLYPLTPEETVMLVKFGLGEPVQREDSNKMVGEHELFDRRIKQSKNSPITTVKAHSVYHNESGTVVVVDRQRDPKTGAYNDNFGNRLVFGMNTKSRSDMTTPMAGKDEADAYLREAVASARENYANALDVERIIAEVEAHLDEEGWSPEYSGDPDIASIQQGYVDVLTGRKETLMRPGRLAEEFEERLSEVGELETETAADSAIYRKEMSDIVYPADMDRAEMVRRHALDAVDYEIGTYERGLDGKRFNPVGVAAHQTSAYGVYRNTDDIVQAMRILDFTADDVKGDNFYTDTVKNKLVKFDFDSARPMMELDSPFMRSMYDEVKSSLTNNGVMFDEKDIRIDKNGIVRYSGDIAVKRYVQADGSDVAKVQGELGQFFEPDEHGVVYTNFNGSQNYAFVPGYEAHIVPLTPGDPKSVEERTILTGYEQAMRQSIRYRLRQDLSERSRKDEYGSPTNLNETYRHLYDERHDYDFVQKFREQGMEEDVLWAIVETEASRVRYPNEVRDGSTIHADYMARTYDRDMANDNTGDAFVLTGGRNMAILTSESDGYFDPMATTATSTNQGTLRFLVEGAKVDADGHIIPSADKDDRCPLFKHEMTKSMEYNPFDRQNMTLSNMMQASAVTRPVNVAQMTFGGWTMDDPVVVSKKFAAEYKMRNRDGHLRDLVVGDKVSDLHGNKGVISLVIDPDMSLDEAERQGIREQVEWFKANPDLDIVMAPFPAVSRFNGGTARELMQNPQNLVAPDGTVMEGAMGAMRMIVTDKSADAKTHVYDDDEVRMGHGRKASAQMAWALNSKDCPAIMRECFGNNGSSLANVREMLITVGLDISETGELRVGYQPHEGEARRVIEMQDPIIRGINKNGIPSMDNKSMSKAFGELIAKQGGVLELPFELKYPTGEPIAPMNDGKTDVIYTKQEWERKGYTRKDGTYVRPTTVHRRQDVGQRQTENVTWGLPVMSSYLRSGQTFEDGTSSVHDYTHQYMDIYLQAMMYKACESRLKESGLTDSVRNELENQMASCQSVAQSRFDRIANSVVQRSFTGKHNVFRDDVMSHKMPNSATAVWTADPRLDIDQVAVGRAMAESIGLNDDDYALIWRDPILRDGGLRYMRVKVDDSLTGVAINPVMDKSFDGDFDGDTVAVINLQTPSAKREAMRKFSIEANLLDYGSGENGKHALFMQESLDVKVAMHERPELKEHFDDIAEAVNGFEQDAATGSINRKELTSMRRDAVKALSKLYGECFDNQCGKAYIRYDGMEHHLESVKAACLDTGAKGSPSKLMAYMKWLGVEEKGVDLDFTQLEDKGHTMATREDHQGVMYACAVKSFGTGIAGSFSQRGVSAMRNRCQKAVLELTYPVTQSLLQSKHDPEEARHKYEMLMGPVRELWRGSLMRKDDNGRWMAVKSADGSQNEAATKDDWKAAFKTMYRDKDGLNVDINEAWVDVVADSLSDENGVMVNIESETVDMSAPLDKLAYGGDFHMLCDMAKSGRNLFEGQFNSQFAPRTVAMNVRAMEKKAELEASGEQVDVPAFRSFTKSDTVESGHDRKMTRKDISVGMARRVPNVPEAGDSDGHGGLGE